MVSPTELNSKLTEQFGWVREIRERENFEKGS